MKSKYTNFKFQCENICNEKCNDNNDREIYAESTPGPRPRPTYLTGSINTFCCFLLLLLLSLCIFLIKSEKPMRRGTPWAATGRRTRDTALAALETMKAHVELVKVQCQRKSGNQFDNIDNGMCS